ncbi:MAG TPA: tetratricopeptide repeat protein, partial [Gemmatimonadales bacterium]|nr:tetratricopeptide repeat protein [Gemmatimonadales bacterium]
ATVGPVDGLELEVPPGNVPFEGMPLESMDQLEGEIETEPVEGLLDTADEDLDLTFAGSDADLTGSDEPRTELELDMVDVAEPDALEADALEEDALEADALEDALEAEPDEAAGLEAATAVDGVAAVAGLPLIEAPPATSDEPSEELHGAAAGALAELESRIAEEPDDPDLHRQLGQRLLDLGELPRAAEELRLALEGHESAGDWAGAAKVADLLVELEPDAIHHHQKRVELAFRTGERAPLLDAYLALGDALARAGATDKATAVYRRVQEHDPDNDRAVAAIAALSQAVPLRPPVMATPAPPATRPVSPPPAPPPATAAPGAPPGAKEPAPAASGAPGGSFVDLGSMILDEGGPRDTRMRIERREPEDQDEQREFAEILEQFKRGIDANLDTDDFQAHYDLGVAFKEMGLLDEAIAEFQKALRAPEGRLRTSEALGTAFFEKGQFAVSEAVLRRAVESVDGGDEAKIGLIYWLGRALEAQGKGADAITNYERAMAVDIRFMDLSERIQRLTAGRRE